MQGLLQFAGLICMFSFLVVGTDYMKSFDNRFIEMFGMIVVAVGVFISSILFYLGWLVKVREEGNIRKGNINDDRVESIIYKNVNSIVDKEVRNLKEKLRLVLRVNRAE